MPAIRRRRGSSRLRTRTALAVRRKRARRREEPLTTELPVGDNALPMIRDRDMLYVLLEEMRTLPQRYQTPLVMRYIEGESRRAIAEQTDSTIGQIQGRLARGRRLLRSRLIRRGVSLSIAAGAMAGTAAGAEAAVSPLLASTTAKTCLAFKASGATSGLSPAALELAKEGVKAMSYASITKFATVATLLVAAGIVWAAQQGDGTARSGVTTAPAHLDLQTAVAETRGAQETAPTKIAASEGGSEKPDQRDAFLAKRLKYRVPFEIGSTESKEGGRIEIEEVWGTRPRIEVGGQYLVRGKYRLPPGQRGKLFFYETATGNWGQPMPDVDLQTVALDKESGEFTLLHEMRGPGYFHLYMASPKKYSHYFANVYFGTGDNVLHKKDWTSNDSAENSKPSGSPSANSNVVENSARRQRENISGEIEKKITDITNELKRKMQNRSEMAVQLEMAQLEKAALQHELEQLRNKLIEIELANITAVDHDDAARQQRETVRDKIATHVEAIMKELEKRALHVAELSNNVELRQRELLGIQRRLDELDRRSIQLEFPQESQPPLDTEKVSEDTWRVPEEAWRAGPRPPADYVLLPDDVLLIRAKGSLADGPIENTFRVDAMGNHRS